MVKISPHPLSNNYSTKMPLNWAVALMAEHYQVWFSWWENCETLEIMRPLRLVIVHIWSYEINWIVKIGQFEVSQMQGGNWIEMWKQVVHCQQCMGWS